MYPFQRMRHAHELTVPARKRRLPPALAVSDDDVATISSHSPTATVPVPALSNDEDDHSLQPRPTVIVTAATPTPSLV